MNERIKELWEQSTGAAVPAEGFYSSASKYNIEKFAELIVRECMELALVEQKRYASITHRNMSECAVALGNFSLLMKDHFEDEE